MQEVIVSFTTYKPRMKNAPLVVGSLLKQTYKNFKICLTLYSGDLAYVTPELWEQINNKQVELIICEEDIAPHKKYYYVMRKYPNAIVITIDDDVIYNDDLVESLMNAYEYNPNVISARRCHKITYNECGRPLPYEDWHYEYTNNPFEPSFDLYATGIGGILYPPHLLHINEVTLDEINYCLYADDVFMKSLENKYLVPVMWVPNSNIDGGIPIRNKETKSSALAVTNNSGGRNDTYISNMGIEKISDELIPDKCLPKKEKPESVPSTFFSFKKRLNIPFPPHFLRHKCIYNNK